MPNDDRQRTIPVSEGGSKGVVQTDALGSTDVMERLSRLRAGMIDEISRREGELLALRGKLSGVEMIIAECVDEE